MALGFFPQVDFRYSFWVSRELLISPFHPQEVSTFYSLVKDNREHLLPWFPELKKFQSIENSQQILNRAWELKQKGRALHSGIWLDNHLIGYLGIEVLSRKGFPLNLGFWVHKGWENQKIMKRTIQALIVKLNQDGLRRELLIRCDSNNTRCSHLAKSLCFNFQGQELEKKQRSLKRYSFLLKGE